MGTAFANISNLQYNSFQMDTQQEKLKITPSHQEAVKPMEKPAAAGEVKKKAAEVMHSDSVEAVEGQEGVEGLDGKISEVSSEDKAHAPAATGGKSYSADEIEAIRAKLLAALPPQDVMIKQIRKKLYKEEKVLTKRMKKLQKKAHTHAFHLTLVTAQLRKVREYFSMLAHATYEMIKHLWLKIVHGV